MVELRSDRSVRVDREVSVLVQDEVVAGTLPDDPHARHGRALPRRVVRGDVELQELAVAPPVLRAGGRSDSTDSLEVAPKLEVHPTGLVEGGMEHEVQRSQQNLLFF